MSTLPRASTWSPPGRNEAGVGGSHSREPRAESKPPANSQVSSHLGKLRQTGLTTLQTTDAQLTKSATDSGATEVTEVRKYREFSQMFTNPT